MEHTGLSFPEAVQDLAQTIGLAVPNETSRGQKGTVSERQTPGLGLGAALQAACEYYCQQLRVAPHAIEYLKRRGLNGEIAARFNIGYAPRGWRNLLDIFDSRYDNSAELVEAGLLIISNKTGTDDSRRYDRFRDRIMFPIRNLKGQVIGFGGRVLDSGTPKYLNSPETPLFNKGSELYGLFEARPGIREKGYALVVEGYMDVVALAQLGFPNAVATLGTACTATHVQKLYRHSDTIVFSFDGDLAGRRAARRALEASLPHMTEKRTARFLFLPDDHDPDSFIRAHGAAAFAAEVERALPLSQFLLNQIVSGKTLEHPEGRAHALADAQPLLQAMPDNALKGQILHMLADRLATPFHEVATLCGTTDTALPPQRSLPARGKRHRVTGNEQRALRNLIMFPQLAHSLGSDDETTLLQFSHARELFSEALNCIRSLGKTTQFSVVCEALRASVNAPLYEEVFREILNYDENIRDVVLHDPADSADASRYRRQEELAAQELSAVAARLRYDAWCMQLERLSRQGRLTSEEVAEFADLSRRAAHLKKQLTNYLTQPSQLDESA
jgi:DNA primase